MNFAQAIETCFRKYASATGRASRSEYWYFTLFTLIVDAISYTADKLLFAHIDWGPVGVVTGVALFLPSLAVQIRRLHDIDRTGRWVLIILTIVGILLLVYWACLKGTQGENDFGPDPLAEPEGSPASAAVPGHAP